MKDRIKFLRKELGLTQQKFAERLGMKGNTIATYESGRNNPIDAVISLICREYDVNEEWLRTGSGSMFVEYNDADADADLVRRTAEVIKIPDPNIRKEVIRLVLELSDEELELYYKHACRLVKAFSDKK